MITYTITITEISEPGRRGIALTPKVEPLDTTPLEVEAANFLTQVISAAMKEQGGETVNPTEADEKVNAQGRG